MKLLKRLFREEEGANLVEYALLIAVIAIVVVVGASLFGDALNTWFADLSTEIPLEPTTEK